MGKRVYEVSIERQMAIDPAGARVRLRELLKDPELDFTQKNRYEIWLNQLGRGSESSVNNQRVLELQEALKSLPMHPNNMRKRNEIMCELTKLGGRFVAEEAAPEPAVTMPVAVKLDGQLCVDCLKFPCECAKEPVTERTHGWDETQVDKPKPTHKKAAKKVAKKTTRKKVSSGSKEKA